MMSTANLEKITTVLEAMIKYELTLFDFYKRCADIWTEDELFWRYLASAELQHSENIIKMREIITNGQERFEAGRPFNSIALNTAMAGLKDNAGRLTSGAFSREKILIMARDIEQSILESNYAEIVKTKDIEYQTLMNAIISQTQVHKKIIQEKIEKTKTKS